MISSNEMKRLPFSTHTYPHDSDLIEYLVTIFMDDCFIFRVVACFYVMN